METDLESCPRQLQAKTVSAKHCEREWILVGQNSQRSKKEERKRGMWLGRPDLSHGKNERGLHDPWSRRHHGPVKSKCMAGNLPRHI